MWGNLLETLGVCCEAGSGGEAACCRGEAMSKGNEFLTRKPAPGLPKPRAGNLNQGKSSREALGCRGVHAKALLLLSLCRYMAPAPPAAACTK